MSVKRRRHSPEFKFKVALEAAKEQQTYIVSDLVKEKVDFEMLMLTSPPSVC